MPPKSRRKRHKTKFLFRGLLRIKIIIINYNKKKKKKKKMNKKNIKSFDNDSLTMRTALESFSKLTDPIVPLN